MNADERIATLALFGCFYVQSVEFDHRYFVASPKGIGHLMYDPKFLYKNSTWRMRTVKLDTYPPLPWDASVIASIPEKLFVQFIESINS